MHRTASDQVTAIHQRLADGCLGDTEFYQLQAQLEDLAHSGGTHRAADDELYAGEPPY